MSADAGTVLPFPCGASPAGRRMLRRDLQNALRVSASPVILDFSACRTLNHRDIDLLLECVAQSAGRDTELILVAGSRANRIVLEVTRMPSLVPVFDSVEEALAGPQVTARNEHPSPPANQGQETWST